MNTRPPPRVGRHSCTIEYKGSLGEEEEENVVLENKVSHELKSEKMSQIERVPIGRCCVRLWKFVYLVNECISTHGGRAVNSSVSVSDVGINAAI